MLYHENSFDKNYSREYQLREYFGIKEIPVQANEEYIKIPLDLPWDELKKDIPLAFEKFGWYGMIHRAMHNWTRTELYGGLGLNYNPTYKFNIPKHAHGFGQPRSIKDTSEDASLWKSSLENYDYKKYGNGINIDGLDTYSDCLGFRNPTEVSSFRSIKSIFDKLKVQTFQGRIAEVKAKEYGEGITEDVKEFIWHTDERNEIISRILIPVVYDEDYWLEFKETGTRLDFEPGYGYHFNTYKVHRWNFNYHKNIKNRTAIVLGFSPWLEFNGEEWTTNKYCNKLHPTDMVKAGLVI